MTTCTHPQYTCQFILSDMQNNMLHLVHAGHSSVPETYACKADVACYTNI